MNANELADAIERCGDSGYNQDAAKMLRQFDLAESIIKQQEIEIVNLKLEWQYMAAKLEEYGLLFGERY